MSSSQIYLLGFIILTIGLSIGAYLLSVPVLYIAVGAVVLIGIGIMATSNRASVEGDV